MDDEPALELAVGQARRFMSGELSPLETASAMTGIINPWRFWWEEMGGAEGPLSTFYSAHEGAIKLHWLSKAVDRWHASVRDKKRADLQAAETKWREPLRAACSALERYADSRHVR